MTLKYLYLVGVSNNQIIYIQAYLVNSCLCISAELIEDFKSMLRSYRFSNWDVDRLADIFKQTGICMLADTNYTLIDSTQFINKGLNQHA